MAPQTAQDLINTGFYGYRGWGDAEAIADYRATGGAGKGSLQAQTQDPGSSAEAVIQSSIDVHRKLIEETSKRFTEYQTRNPFTFDDILAEKRGEAKEQLDPYYNETLSDYLLGVQRKKERGIQDTRDLLAELQAQTSAYTEGAQLKLDEAINRAREGFADVGLFESGKRFREGEGLPTAETGMQTEDFLRRQGLRGKIAETGLSRSLEDIGLEKKQQVRGVERERFTNIEQLAGQLTKEAGQRYVAGFQAALPPEYQATNNFDLLKQIGIYS